ncbi:MAG: hypothetical protein ACLTZB_01170 [Streptococcus salivarius]
MADGLNYSRRVLNNLRLIDTWSDNQRFVDSSLQLRYIDSAVLGLTRDQLWT